MAVSAKKRAERVNKAKQRWKKRQQNRPVAKRMVTLLHWMEGAPEGIRPVAKIVLPIELIYEPMKDQAFDALPQHWRDGLLSCSVPDRQKLYEQLAFMEDACQQIPHVAQVWNYLGNLYVFAGKNAAGTEAHRQSFEWFPEYFIGRMAYALCCLQDGDEEGALRVLGGDVDLVRLLNGRTRMHLSEFANYLLICTMLCIERNELEQAALHLDTFEEFYPGHMMIPVLADTLHAAGWDGWEEDDVFHPQS